MQKKNPSYIQVKKSAVGLEYHPFIYEVPWINECWPFFRTLGCSLGFARKKSTSRKKKSRKFFQVRGWRSNENVLSRYSVFFFACARMKNNLNFIVHTVFYCTGWRNFFYVAFFLCRGALSKLIVVWEITGKIGCWLNIWQYNIKFG